jgi:hypothetical protein
MATVTRRDTLRYLVGVGVASTLRADMSWAQEGTFARSIRVSTRAFVRIWRIVRKAYSVKFFVSNNQHWFESNLARCFRA